MKDYYLGCGKLNRVVGNIFTVAAVILVFSSLISCRAGEVESLDLRSSHALIFSNISVRTL